MSGEPTGNPPEDAAVPTETASDGEKDFIVAQCTLVNKKVRMNQYAVTINVNDMQLGVGTLYITRDLIKKNQVSIELGGDLTPDFDKED